jgi:catechol 2,3-dioxygenase-like lactoylglutathione lyase family enzyme
MAVELNHIIIPATDGRASAQFLAAILGLEVGPEWAHFAPVRTANGVTLDFASATEFRPQHYALLVGEGEFDAALALIGSSGVKFFAEFDGTGIGEVNRLYGGRGVYFNDANGHLFELVTRPYGPIPERWIDGAAVTSAG